MPPRLCLLAAEAWRRDLVTEGYLAEMLRLDRISVREMVGNALIDDGMDEAPHPPG